ncbi:MAG: HAMP domain-containing sensor histidine kinase, partial [Candidatus Eiseniibacteriota bacterium]
REVRVIEADLWLANRMRALMELYRTMTHDLKAPLNATMINLDLLRRSLDRKIRSGEEDAEARTERFRYLDLVQSELARLSRSLQKFIAHAGQATASRSEFDLRRLVREVVQLMQPYARQQQIELRLEITDSGIPSFGYRDRLHQALINVVMNGIEAMPDGGVIDIDLHHTGERAVLTIHDHGVGMEREQLEKAYHLHVTSKQGGSGIGLFITRAIIVEHGGEITLASTPHVGTTVMIQLPIAGHGDGLGEADQDG